MGRAAHEKPTSLRLPVGGLDDVTRPHARAMACGRLAKPPLLLLARLECLGGRYPVDAAHQENLDHQVADERTDIGDGIPRG